MSRVPGTCPFYWARQSKNVKMQYLKGKEEKGKKMKCEIKKSYGSPAQKMSHCKNRGKSVAQVDNHCLLYIISASDLARWKLFKHASQTYSNTFLWLTGHTIVSSFLGTPQSPTSTWLYQSVIILLVLQINWFYPTLIYHLPSKDL